MASHRGEGSSQGLLELQQLPRRHVIIDDQGSFSIDEL